MANTRMIYISDELNEKLSKEENASLLISKLLNDYYRLNVSKLDEIEERQKEIDEKRRKFNEQFSEEYATLETRKQVIKKERESEEEIKARQKRKREEQINNILGFFKDLMGRDITKEELSDYLFRFENETGFNMYKFVDEIHEREK